MSCLRKVIFSDAEISNKRPFSQAELSPDCCSVRSFHVIFFFFGNPVFLGAKVPESLEGKQILQPSWLGSHPHLRQWICLLIRCSACIWRVKILDKLLSPAIAGRLLNFCHQPFPANPILLPWHLGVFGILTRCWRSISPLLVWASNTRFEEIRLFVIPPALIRNFCSYSKASSLSNGLPCSVITSVWE